MFEEYTREILTLIGVFLAGISAGILITEYGIWRAKGLIEKIFPEFKENGET